MLCASSLYAPCMLHLHCATCMVHTRFKQTQCTLYARPVHATRYSMHVPCTELSRYMRALFAPCTLCSFSVHDLCTLFAKSVHTCACYVHALCMLSACSVRGPCYGHSDSVHAPCKLREHLLHAKCSVHVVFMKHAQSMNRACTEHVRSAHRVCNRKVHGDINFGFSFSANYFWPNYKVQIFEKLAKSQNLTWPNF